MEGTSQNLEVGRTSTFLLKNICGSYADTRGEVAAHLQSTAKLPLSKVPSPEMFK